MTLTFCLAAIVSRPARPANTLAMAGLATLAWNPFFLFDVGCQLSFLAIAALIWLVPRAQHGVDVLAGSLAIDAARSTPSPIVELERKFEPWWRGADRGGSGTGFAQGFSPRPSSGWLRCRWWPCGFISSRRSAFF